MKKKDNPNEVISCPPGQGVLFDLNGAGLQGTASEFIALNQNGRDMMRYAARLLEEDGSLSVAQRNLMAQAYNAILPTYLLTKLQISLRYSPIKIGSL